MYVTVSCPHPSLLVRTGADYVSAGCVLLSSSQMQPVDRCLGLGSVFFFVCVCVSLSLPPSPGSLVPQTHALKIKLRERRGRDDPHHHSVLTRLW